MRTATRRPSGEMAASLTQCPMLMFGMIGSESTNSGTADPPAAHALAGSRKSRIPFDRPFETK